MTQTCRADKLPCPPEGCAVDNETQTLNCARYGKAADVVDELALQLEALKRERDAMRVVVDAARDVVEKSTDPPRYWVLLEKALAAYDKETSGD